MRARSTSHRHRYDAASQPPTTTHNDPGWRLNRRVTRSLHSPRPESRARFTTALKNFASPSEDTAAGDAVEVTSSRFRTTAAAYGAPTSYAPLPKPLAPPQLSGHSRLAGYGAEAKENGGLLDSSRYVTYDTRRSSLGYISPLSSSPVIAGAHRGSTAAEETTSYRTSSRYVERSGTARAASPLPSRHGGSAAVAGVSLHAKTAETPPPSSYLIPPPQPQDVGKLVVVLDLDETLVYSRDITLYERPGVTQLLKTLKGRCELIVWTAGTREYALDVIRIIDTVCAVQHCIYRHPMWWSGDTGCAKDLRMLGRPMDRVILVDNTPSVFTLNPRNSLLVTDFIVPFPRSYDAQEKVLSTLTDIFDHVFRRFSQPCLADVLASKRITRQIVYLEHGIAVELNVLVVRSTAEADWTTSRRASKVRYAP